MKRSLQEFVVNDETEDDSNQDEDNDLQCTDRGCFKDDHYSSVGHVQNLFHRIAVQ